MIHASIVRARNESFQWKRVKKDTNTKHVSIDSELTELNQKWFDHVQLKSNGNLLVSNQFT